VLLSCRGQPNNGEHSNKQPIKEVVQPEFQFILDSAGVEGSILIYDLQKNVYYSNDFNWATVGRLPASTFKIANSIIALETEIIQNDSTLIKWDGEDRALPIWEQDLIFRDAFHYSCVPCYQEIAREIGVQRMTDYVNKLNYGVIVLDSTSIDNFWLEGESQINQIQQINFLRRFYQSDLPISKRTENIMKKLMVMETNDDYILSGKTGWSIRNGNNNGWFVGYIQTSNNVHFFATNINPNKEFNMDLFPSIRKSITFQALRQMQIIN
jgi:beta-lactamase class D